jgi:SAM-dependent methyltransferase
MKTYHEIRLAPDGARDTLWKTLCEAYFQRLIKSNDCVLELGAGYGCFINHIRCRRRIAVDVWQGMLEHLQAGVEGHVGPVTELGAIEDSSVDFVFASNLFEHLPKPEFANTLAALRAKMKAGATLNILQPNYRFAYREYFDDYTHISIYSDRSLADFLQVNEFRVTEVHPGFLPLTIKSRLPVSPALIRLYLASPFKPFSKQMLIRAVR